MMKKKTEFSKKLLIQESILIWIVTLGCLVLAYFCIMNDSYGDLPWLTAMVGLPWAAYGVSQMYYYKKAMAENTANGIVYEKAMQTPNIYEESLEEQEEEIYEEDP